MNDRPFADENLSLGFDSSELDAVRAGLESINLSAERMSRTLVRAFAGAVVGGRSLEETLRSIALSMSRMGLSAGLQPLQRGLSSLVQSALSSFAGASGGPVVTPFAEGGIVSRPTFFGAGGGLGLMGERGAEAIMPLARGADGRLGVAINGAGSLAQQQPVNVTVNISTPDIDSFRSSQVQVASALARAAARGRRGL